MLKSELFLINYGFMFQLSKSKGRTPVCCVLMLIICLRCAALLYITGHKVN